MLPPSPVPWPWCNAFRGKGLTKAGNPLASYNRSKKMYACFTRDLARRVQGEGIDVFAVHPGKETYVKHACHLPNPNTI